MNKKIKVQVGRAVNIVLGGKANDQIDVLNKRAIVSAKLAWDFPDFIPGNTKSLKFIVGNIFLRVSNENRSFLCLPMANLG